MPDTRELSLDGCLVWGGYGWGNTGDDLTLAVALNDLHRTGRPSASVITPGGEHTRHAHPDAPLLAPPNTPPGKIAERVAWYLADHASRLGRQTTAARLYRLALRCQRTHGADPNLRRAFTVSTSLHLVGGGYLTDRFDLNFMLRPIRLARAMNLAVTTSPLGIGPFKTPRAARAVARALQGCCVKVRDSASLQFCRSHQLHAEEHPDDGFRMAEVVPPGAMTSPGKSTPRRIGICIFNQYGTALSATVEDWWVDCLQSLGQQMPDFQIEGFCFHTEEALDLQTTCKLFERSGLNPENVQPPEPDFRKAVKMLERFDGIISTRFHAVVAALVLGRPSVAVGMNEYYAIKMGCALKHASSPAVQVDPLQDSPRIASQFLARHLDYFPAVQEA